MKKYDSVIDKVDSLRQYTYRHLSSVENIRANSFIKILLKLPKSNFNAKRLKNYSQKYIDKLLKTRYVITAKISEVEIIPFHHLLEILFEMLENQKPRKQKSAIKK